LVQETLRNSARGASPNLSLTKERSSRASRAAGTDRIDRGQSRPDRSRTGLTGHGEEESEMPWRETCMEQERESFVLAVLGGEMAMSRLCAVWGISRSNGYKWLRRYQESGRAGLRDRSRAPQHHGRAMPAEVTELLCAGGGPTGSQLSQGLVG